MKINKNNILGFFLLCILSVQGLIAQDLSGIKEAHLIIKSKEVPLVNCSKSMLNCTVTVTQNTGCLAQPGSVSITNTSTVPAKNISVFSSDPNFTNYIIQNNACPTQLAPGASCTISFYTNALVAFTLSGIAVQGSNTNATYFNMNAILCKAVLTPSLSSLALSVNQSGALTGTPRYITLTNTGLQSASGLTITPPIWTAIGTTYSTTCGSTLSGSGGTCTITVTPGSTATSACDKGHTPTPDIITVSATNASPISLNILVLSYGCIYQGGYIFAVDDTTPTSGNIAGIVLQTTDATSSSGIFWDSSSGCITAPYDSCYITNADSGSNGTNLAGGNTNIIYNLLTTTNAEDPTTYAAGLCTGTFSGYSDWYLPAICEMGYNANNAGINCGTSAAPTLQNIQSNLIDFENMDVAGLATGGNPLYPGSYWSSTEYSVLPNYDAWAQNFAVGAGSQFYPTKGTNPVGVRCARALIP